MLPTSARLFVSLMTACSVPEEGRDERGTEERGRGGWDAGGKEVVEGGGKRRGEKRRLRKKRKKERRSEEGEANEGHRKVPRYRANRAPHHAHLASSTWCAARRRVEE